jgi:hypothetical protein
MGTRKHQKLAWMYRKISPAFIKSMNAQCDMMLTHAKELYEKCDMLDTAVRDTVCKGLAYIVHSAYDCKSCALDLQGEASWSFISNATAEWFRTRGFAEWFCHGAGACFNTSRPRDLGVTGAFNFGVRRLRRVKSKKQKAAK